MKKMLAESELARDERFVRTKIEDRIFDPRGAAARGRATPVRPRWRIDRPAAAERSRSLMHGIFVGEIQALEGAGRTCFDFDDAEAPFQLKLDMARQCWDESRHCEISMKLGDHMGSEIGEYTESDLPLRGRVQPRPGAAPLRRQPRARGPRDRRVQLDEGVRDRVAATRCSSSARTGCSPTK